ncbi:MAG: hypothetical protein VB087_07920 [Candidatus Limiplasma sp.]|nr:hypothetical protein [Candidatus Limiplasma sp.]
MFRFSPIFYRDECGAPAGSPVPAPIASAPAAGSPASAADIAAAVLKAVGERTTRAENGVVKSMATEYGMTEEQLKAVLDKHKADQAAKLPESAQKQIEAATEKAHTLLIAAEVKTLGATLGLVDAEAALALLHKEERDKIKVDEAGNVTGVKEALEALQKSKPYLFGAPGKPVAMAQRVSGGTPGALSELEERFYARNPELRPK